MGEGVLGWLLHGEIKFLYTSFRIELGLVFNGLGKTTKSLK